MKNSQSISSRNFSQERFFLLTLVFIAFFILGNAYMAHANNDKNATLTDSKLENNNFTERVTFAVTILDTHTQVPIGTQITIKGLAPKYVDATGKIYITSADLEVLGKIWDGKIPFIYKGTGAKVKTFFLDYPMIPPSVINFQ